MKRTFSKACLLGTLIPLLLASQATAATINWDPTATNFNNDPTQVINTGSLVAALTIYGTASTTLTLNGVTFQNYQSVSNPNIVFHLFDTPQPSGPSSPSDYTKLVSTGSYVPDGSAAGGSYGAVLQNLTIGQTYTIQAWTAYWGSPIYTTRFSSSLPTGTPTANATPQSPTLNIGFVTGGIVPQFATGTFTADATTQNFYYYGDNGYGIFGALQVRTSPVPEPQTWALAALGASALLFRLRRKQRVVE